MAANHIPACIRCKNLPTYFRVEHQGYLTHYIKCFNCKVATPKFSKEDGAIYYWGVELANNLAITQSIRNCKQCRAPAQLVNIKDRLGIEVYTVKCSVCPTQIRFPRKTSDGIITLWNKLYGVNNV